MNLPALHPQQKAPSIRGLEVVPAEQRVNQCSGWASRGPLSTGPELDRSGRGMESICDGLKATQLFSQLAPGLGEGNRAAHGSPAHVCQHVNLYSPGVFGLVASLPGDLHTLHGRFLGRVVSIHQLPIDSDLVLQGLHGILHGFKYTNIVRECKGEF